MITSFLLTLLPLREKVDRASSRETDEGAAKRKHLTQSNHTPHPPFGHLLPQGEKGNFGN
jgi:hypothetical protein